jgi:hypothetical protein
LARAINLAIGQIFMTARERIILDLIKMNIKIISKNLDGIVFFLLGTLTFHLSDKSRYVTKYFRIIHHPLNPKSSDVIKIVAFAGTGKTTTLINLCKENPNLKFLVIMYNR